MIQIYLNLILSFNPSWKTLIGFSLGFKPAPSSETRKIFRFRLTSPSETRKGWGFGLNPLF